MLAQLATQTGSFLRDTACPYACLARENAPPLPVNGGIIAVGSARAAAIAIAPPFSKAARKVCTIAHRGPEV